MGLNHAAFQLNKFRRAIRVQGRIIEVTKPTLNKFKEPNGEAETFEIKGIFHESVAGVGYIGKSTSEAATIRQKSLPILLCLWEDASEVTLDCTFKLNEKPYKVCEVKNLAEANVVAEISLEEVQGNGQRSEV